MSRPVRNIRLTPFNASYLGSTSGASGEVYYDVDRKTLRIMDGKTSGGSELAVKTLSNVSNSDFLAKATAAGVGSTIGGLSYNQGANQLTTTATFIGTQQKNYLRFHWDTLADLNAQVSPILWHGMIAHVHETGRLYFAHSGAWTPVANVSDIPTGGGSANLGNIEIANSTLSTSDSSAIIFDQVVQLNSDMLLGANLILSTGADRFVGQASNRLRFNGDITLQPASTKSVFVETNISETKQSWNFTSAGTLVFPDGSIQSTAFSGAGVGSINNLSDVDTVTTPPNTGNVLKWNGTNWVPGTDVTTGGGGTDADTLDGQDSAYYLNFNNLSNKPNTFGTIVVGSSTVLADDANDTLTLASGAGITLSANVPTDTITITGKTYAVSATTNQTGTADLTITDNDAVASNVTFAVGTGISIDRTASNIITFTNTSPAPNTFGTISVAGQNDVVAETSTDTLTLVAGTNIVLTTDATTDTITIAASSGASTLSFSTIAITGTVTPQTNVVADSTTDTLTIEAGTGIDISTNATTDTITIALASTVSNTFGTVAITGTASQSNVVADSAGDTLTLNAGTGISLLSNANTDTITIANSFNQVSNLQDVSASQRTIDQLYLPAITMLTVTVTGATAYNFDQYGAGNNPTIYAMTGTTIAFNFQFGGASHPFLIQTTGGVNYNTGLVHCDTTGTVNTDSSAQGKNLGTLYWKVPSGVSGNYRYQCATHPVMQGTIVVKDFPSI